MSTSLAGIPRFRRPGPSMEVEAYLRRLVARLAPHDADRVLKVCRQTRARTVDALPGWVRSL